MKTFKQYLYEKYDLGPVVKFTDKEGTEYDLQRTDYIDQNGKPRISYEVRLKGKAPGSWTVAGTTLSAKGTEAMSLFVRPEHQRKGIATRLYNYIEKDIGHKLNPSWALTDDGEAFWNSRKKAK